MKPLPRAKKKRWNVACFARHSARALLLVMSGRLAFVVFICLVYCASVYLRARDYAIGWRRMLNLVDDDEDEDEGGRESRGLEKRVLRPLISSRMYSVVRVHISLSSMRKHAQAIPFVDFTLCSFLMDCC